MEHVDVKKGDSGDGVHAVQTSLVKHGATIKIDGEFGPATEEAVKEFQKKHSLKEDGIVGVHTLKALED